jgi:hypothetical protein
VKGKTVDRRTFLRGLVATAAGVLIPASVAAEPERRIWALDSTMVTPSTWSIWIDPSWKDLQAGHVYHMAVDLTAVVDAHTGERFPIVRTSGDAFPATFRLAHDDTAIDTIC